MEKAKKIKLFIGLFYSILVIVFLYLFFSKFTLQEISSYDFIRNNRNYFFELRQSNLFILATLFILFTVIWVLAAGFGSPIGIFSGFIFGQWFGALFAVIGLSVGATLLYLFANYFLKDFIKKNFSEKYKNLEVKFKKNEFNFFLIYRLIGGIPFAIANLLPIIFNISLKNYFFGTFFGILPSLFIIASLSNWLSGTHCACTFCIQSIYYYRFGFGLY